MTRSEPVLYADHLGGWFLLSGPPGFQTVDAIAQYTRIGPVTTLIRLIGNWLNATMPRVRQYRSGHQRPQIQQIIADGMGVSQRAVSTWMLGTSQPDLYAMEPDGVRWLIQAARCATSWQWAERGIQEATT